jgi:antitoxin CptB
MNDQTRRRRLLFRSHHRGTNEMDRLMGSFADAHVPDFTTQQLDQYEAILNLNDPDVLNWVTGVEPAPSENDTEVLRLLIAHQYARKK